MRSIILIGASVGKEWDIERFPSRAGLPQLQAEYHGHYRFDKTPVLDRLLQKDGPLPDMVILKECAAYFPMDPGEGRKLVSGWIDRCRARGVIPVPATVAPVTRPGMLAGLVRKIRRRPVPADRLHGIHGFNDWIMRYAAGEGLEILDLERCLRVSPTDRSLRPDFHSGDGLHLNSRAYSEMDRELIQVVRTLFPDIAPVRSP